VNPYRAAVSILAAFNPQHDVFELGSRLCGKKARTLFWSVQLTSSSGRIGENWAQFAGLIDEDRIRSAEESLASLMLDVSGKRVLDIGSGSGLFSLAALRLGAKEVLSVDIDENSVLTTSQVLSNFSPSRSWKVLNLSVFDLDPTKHGVYPVVYSWGVLHHTGDLWRAVLAASRMVQPGGLMAFALYERTPLCGAWRIEKALYRKAPHVVQSVVRYAYLGAYCLGVLASGRNPFAKSRQRRGMSMTHDAHDWLGGYPYESTTSEEVRAKLAALGFSPVLERPVRVHLLGLFGTGCSEFVYRRTSEA
jgi:2-polyprenyl-3-methyl-5-hydroxy-6-metoxy-1,4-benzoquinol methylase